MMNISKLLKPLRVIVPSLSLGIFFIWIGTSDLTPKQYQEIIAAFKNADYFWIIVSLLLAVLSHLSRSIRWHYSLAAIDIHTSFWNRYLTLLINYFTNLAIPRAGEITRCALLSKYEKQGFDKIFGTLVVERLVDLFMLFLLSVIFFISQYSRVHHFLLSMLSAKFSFTKNLFSNLFLLLGLLLLLVLALLAIRWIKRSRSKVAYSLRLFWKGLKQGFMTVFTMKQKRTYFAHTLFIWLCYVGMFGVCFWALPETSEASLSVMLIGFIFGSLAMVLTQGGLGAYPLFVMQGLALYGLSETAGYALGWIIWSSQTLMVVIFGVIALIVLPLYNKYLTQC